MSGGDSPSWFTVVGVTGNVRQWRPGSTPLAELYWDYMVNPRPNMYVILNAEGDPRELVRPARAAVLEVDPQLPVSQIQTMGDLLVEEGVMTEEQARESGMHNVLSSALGADYIPAIGLLDFRFSDVLLLCTDGLTKHVTDEEIVAILERGEAAEPTCRALVDAALEDGGTDNVTVVVCRMVPPAE